MQCLSLPFLHLKNTHQRRVRGKQGTEWLCFLCSRGTHSGEAGILHFSCPLVFLFDGISGTNGCTGLHQDLDCVCLLCAPMVQISGDAARRTSPYLARMHSLCYPSVFRSAFSYIERSLAILLFNRNPSEDEIAKSDISA